MARPIASLNPDSLEPALEYLRRAVERDPKAVLKKPNAASASLGHLDVLLSRTDSEHKPERFREWVLGHMTDPARVRMLNAVRRRRADARRPRSKVRRSITVPPETLRNLQALAKKTGMPMTNMLAAFAAIGNVDQKLREQLLKLGVAINLK